MEVEAVSINGRVHPTEKAFVNVVDRGFMFGHGAFETFRVTAGKIFLLEEHFARLDKNLKALGISWQFDQVKHLSWIKDLTNNLPENKDGRIRFCVTSGNGYAPSVVIYLSYIDKFQPSEKDVRILKSLARHKPEYFDITGFRVKSLEYSYLYIARKELGDDRIDGILLNPAGYVAEALTSNVFWVKDGIFYTPPLSLGILAGTMRGWLLDNFKVEEKLAREEEFIEADEIFLTAGANYLTAVSRVNDRQKPGASGPDYKKTCSLLTSHLAENSIKL